MVLPATIAIDILLLSLVILIFILKLICMSASSTKTAKQSDDVAILSCSGFRINLPSHESDRVSD